MNITNPQPRRGFQKDECLVGVINANGDLVHTETRRHIDFGPYAKQMHAKFGPCRVAFKPLGAATWREVRWKNMNSGTLYRRPSYVTLNESLVPDMLKLMDMVI